MTSTPAQPESDTLLPVDPVEMDMSGFETPKSPFFHDRRVWSSVAVVVMLHATLAWLLVISAKPSAESPRIVEAQLVMLPGGPDQAGGGRPAQAGPKEGGGAKSICPARPAAVPSPPAVPVKKHPAKLHRTVKVVGVLPPDRKIHSRVRKRYRRIARVFHLHGKKHEIDTIKPVERSKTEPGTIQTHGVGQIGAEAFPGTGKSGGAAAGGAGGHGGTGNINGPGGSGTSEIAFGSPYGPHFLHEVAPSYPALARRLEKQGTVLLRVTINKHGRPVKVEVLKKAGFGMDKEAVKAIEKSTFVPARRNGRPLTCRALLPIKFVLESS